MHPYCIEPDADLSVAELTAARIDGEVMRVGEAWVPCDTIESSWLRARTLLTVLGHDLAAVGFTAAWVHGAVLVRPARLSVRRACARRPSAVMRFGVEYHDARIDPSDVMCLGHVQVSTTVRTAVDIAREATRTCRDALMALDAASPGTIAAALDWIGRHPGAPLIRRARPRLIEALRQDEVTR